jgi:hypothetical protein
MSITEWLDNFPWESDVQRQSVGAIQKYLRELPPSLKANDADVMRCVLAFIFQKDHEWHEWWTATFGDQVSRLQAEIKRLEERIMGLELGEVKRGAR